MRPAVGKSQFHGILHSPNTSNRNRGIKNKNQKRVKQTNKQQKNQTNQKKSTKQTKTTTLTCLYEIIAIKIV